VLQIDLCRPCPFPSVLYFSGCKDLLPPVTSPFDLNWSFYSLVSFSFPRPIPNLLFLSLPFSVLIGLFLSFFFSDPNLFLGRTHQTSASRRPQSTWSFPFLIFLHLPSRPFFFLIPLIQFARCGYCQFSFSAGLVSVVLAFSQNVIASLFFPSLFILPCFVLSTSKGLSFVGHPPSNKELPFELFSILMSPPPCCLMRFHAARSCLLTRLRFVFACLRLFVRFVLEFASRFSLSEYPALPREMHHLMERLKTLLGKF